MACGACPAVSAQVLKTMPGQLDAPASCAVSLRRAAGIREMRSVGDEGLLSTYRGNDQQRGENQKNCSDDPVRVLATLHGRSLHYIEPDRLDQEPHNGVVETMIRTVL